jgi:DNA-binding transcriptional MerR regulator
MPHYSPREVADKTGFSLDTLRYYEKIGLLVSVARSSGGRRVFTEDDVAWLGILQCLRETGMPIASMLRYAELARRGDHTIAERLGLLEDHDRRSKRASRSCAPSSSISARRSSGTDRGSAGAGLPGHSDRSRHCQ